MQSTNDAYLHADLTTVAPKVSGYVEHVLVRDNQAVAAGQPLVRIDPRSYGLRPCRRAPGRPPEGPGLPEQAQLEAAQAGARGAAAGAS